MTKTKSFRSLVERHIKRDKEFAEALLREGVDAARACACMSLDKAGLNF
jgi:hypothetical protein